MHTFSKSFKRLMPRLFAALAIAVLLSSCEDLPPDAYIPLTYVEGYLFVDRPIEGIVIAKTQPLTQPYKYGNGSIPNAQVTVTGGGNTYQLQYREVDGVGTYYFPDTTALIQPKTEYNLEVRLADGGGVITATTTTPDRIAWVTRPHDYFQYPSDTTKLPIIDSLSISWTKGNNTEYLIRVRVLDTLNYGAYLQPPTSELNERTNANGETAEDTRDIYSKAMWGFVQTTAVPVVWKAFRWYGKNEIAVIAADKAFLSWFKLTQFAGNPASYNQYYSNIVNGAGVFGSASIITHESVMLKRAR